MLLKHGLVDTLALLDVVHPFPGSSVQCCLLIYGGVVIKLITILSSQLPILLLDHRKIRLEIFGK